MADRRMGEKRRNASDCLERIQFSAPRRLPLPSDVIKNHQRFLMWRLHARRLPAFAAPGSCTIATYIFSKPLGFFQCP